MKLANASLALLLSQLSAAYLCDGTKFTVNWVVGSSGNPSEYMTQETGISEYAVETLGPWYMLKFKTKDAT
ncbi:hypothetical protein PENVUL_c001G07412 [Penicillium vulpinum]|uniref:Uncharacterized protein n=1 Tax=Penicillium vulpinum TaxID=29845 RepID=A0A1V6SED6_9EURO|nr:hypothetical protein PENVUL_c001G07412 [Penicillium vulpinum]